MQDTSGILLLDKAKKDVRRRRESVENDKNTKRV